MFKVPFASILIILSLPIKPAAATVKLLLIIIEPNTPLYDVISAFNMSSPPIVIVPALLIVELNVIAVLPATTPISPGNEPVVISKELFIIPVIVDVPAKYISPLFSIKPEITVPTVAPAAGVAPLTANIPELFIAPETVFVPSKNIFELAKL